MDLGGGSPRKVDVITANVNAISRATGWLQHLQRSGSPQVGIPGRTNGEEIVAANIHEDEGTGSEETAAIGAWFKSMALNVDGRFGDEIGLILFLHRA